MHRDENYMIIRRELEKFKVLAAIYEQFYGESINNNPFTIEEKVNSLVYILWSQFNICPIDNYYVTFLEEKNRLYSPSLMDIVHKHQKKFDNSKEVKLTDSTIEKIETLKNCVASYVTLHNDSNKVMNDLSVVLYIRRNHPFTTVEEIAAKNLNCTKFEVSCIQHMIEKLDSIEEAKEYKIRMKKPC